MTLMKNLYGEMTMHIAAKKVGALILASTVALGSAAGAVQAHSS